MFGLPDLAQLTNLASQAKSMDRQQLLLAALKGQTVLRGALAELLKQMKAELETQKETDLKELAKLQRELKHWLEADLPPTRRLQDVPELGERIFGLMENQAKRLGARSTDLSRVSLTYSRMQSLADDHRQAQAYAPFFLSFHEAKAGMVLENMHPDKRATLVPYAQRIRQAQLNMGDKTRCYSDCGLCERPLGDETGGGCCSSNVGKMFTPMDGIYRRLLGERAPVWPTFNEDWSRCGYMGPTGCVLPAGSRPITCIGFYCNTFRQKLDADGVWRSLSPDFSELRAGVRELEFRFNLNRRFLLKNQPQTIHDGSMGYLYDKFMAIYASYDKITQTGVEGVDATAEEPAEPSLDPIVVPPHEPSESPMGYAEGSAQVADLLRSLEFNKTQEDSAAAGDTTADSGSQEGKDAPQA